MRQLWMGWFLVATAAGAIEAPYRLETSLGGWSVDGTTERATTAGLRLQGSGRYPLATNLEARGAVAARLESGAFQARYSDAFSPRNTLEVREAVLAWSPASRAQLQGGVLAPTLWGNPLVLYDRPVPGASEGITFSNGAFSFDLTAQQAIVPYSHLSSAPGLEMAQAPYFFFERVAATYRPDSRLLAAISLAHFSFENLGSSLAHSSRFLGNGVSGAGPEGSRFTTGFQGLSGVARFGWSAGRYIQPTVEANWIANLKADAGRGWGHHVRLSNAFEIAKGLRVAPAVQWFSAGADIGPAVLGNRFLGFQNRRGWGVGAVLTTDDSLEVGAEFVQAATQTDSPYQGNFRSVRVYVGRTYAF